MGQSHRRGADLGGGWWDMQRAVVLEAEAMGLCQALPLTGSQVEALLAQHSQSAAK